MGHMAVIPAGGRLRQEDCKFEVSLSCMGSKREQNKRKQESGKAGTGFILVIIHMVLPQGTDLSEALRQDKQKIS